VDVTHSIVHVVVVVMRLDMKSTYYTYCYPPKISSGYVCYMKHLLM